LNNRVFNTNLNAKPLIIYLVVGFFSLIVRHYSNFAQELIPGVNGGYYPVQVRSLLENGHLAFFDMPLLFYLDAAVIKILSFFGAGISDGMILNTVKLVDCISLPLLLFPLYKLIRLLNPGIALLQEAIVVLFSLLSVSPLFLVGDLQKNTIAIPLALASVYYLLQLLKHFDKRNFAAGILFSLLTALAHFGTFAWLVFLVSLVLIIHLRKKALFPLLILVIAGLSIVAVLDAERFYRVLNLWNVVFEYPALLNGQIAPPDILSIIMSYILIAIGIIQLRKKNSYIEDYKKVMIIACMAALFIYSFPLLDVEYFRRLNLMSFILQFLLAVSLLSLKPSAGSKGISIAFSIFVVLSLFGFAGKRKEPVITQDAFKEIQNISRTIDFDKDRTVIIARHGLEWWTAWALKTKIGQDKAIDKTLFEKYQNVIFINQLKGFIKERQNRPFHEPIVPPNTKLIYSSDYFKVFKLVGP